MTNWIGRILPEYDKERFSAQQIRNMAVVDSVCVAACILFLLYTVVFSFYWIVLRDGWYEFVDELIFAFAALAPIPSHRLGYRFKVYAIMVWAVCYVIYFAYVARLSGTHFILAASPCILVFLLGTRAKFEALFVSTLAYVLFLFINLAVPVGLVDEVNPWEQISSQLKTVWLEFDGQLASFIFVAFVTGLVMFVTTYVAYARVEKSEAALKQEHLRSEMLLRSLLPNSIAARLKEEPDAVVADEFEDVTILFADIVGFTMRSSDRPPSETVAFLNRIFSRFDKLAEAYGLEKIKTIGDEYMVAGGMPDVKEGHSESLANMALDMMVAVEEISHQIGEKVELRIGIHAGPAVAGVIGRNKPFYDVWGDTINVASRMQSSGEPGLIQITRELKKLLGEKYLFEKRGFLQVKGKGKMEAFALIGKRNS